MVRKSRIPENAKLAFKGAIFEVWQWDQQMFDGSFETFEMLRRADTAAVIAVVDNKVLLQKEEQPGREPFISVPGGRIEEGESPLEGAKREMLEETGYVSDDFELIIEHRPHNKIDWTMFGYVARNCKKIQEPQPDSGEKIEPLLVSFEDLLKMPDHPHFRATEFKDILLRAHLDSHKREELRLKLFPTT